MHTMCRSSWTSICSSVAMKSPRKREKPIVEEFFLPCTAMCRKFHSLCFAQIISDMDSSDDYRAATTSLSQGLFPSWWSLVLSCCANSAFCIVSASFFSLHLSLHVLHPFPSLPPILIAIFQHSSSHLDVHRWNPHEAPFYSSKQTWIQKHVPASDHHCFISHIPIEHSNTSLV